MLTFDQFAELFTTHRGRWRDAEVFFRQVHDALAALPNLGVVFAMREDHVAEVDPYAPLFPRRLRAKFRMERLGPRGALAAVQRPENAGCPFAPGVAGRLVDDLRRAKVQRYANLDEETSIVGPFVEPVQLQVVCNRLWANLPDDKANPIQWQEVERYGNPVLPATDHPHGHPRPGPARTGGNRRTAQRSGTHRRRRLRRVAIAGLVVGLILMTLVVLLVYQREQRARQAKADARIAQAIAEEQRSTAIAEAATAEAAKMDAENQQKTAEAAKTDVDQSTPINQHCFLRDPSGYLIEIQRFLDPTWANATSP